MSKDIRSYFQASNKTPVNKKTNKSVNNSNKIIDLDEEIPETPTIDKKVKNYKRQRIASDDEDSGAEFTSANTKKSELSNNRDKNKRKEIKLIDIFGTTPVKRSKTCKRDSSKNNKSEEANTHNDDSFSKTLNEPTKSVNKNRASSPSPTKVASKESQKKNCHKIQDKPSDSKSDKTESKLCKSFSPPKNCENNSTVANKIKSDEKLDITKIKEEAVILNKQETKFPDETSSDIKLKTPNSSKKSKVSKVPTVPELTDEERHERKRYSAQLYKSYLNRSGPKNLGSKEIPEGSSNCLSDCVFIITGVLNSFEKDDVIAAIKKFGGEVKGTFSGKVSHVICGDEPGPSKIARAQQTGTPILSEDEFLNLIITNSNGKKPEENNQSKTPISKIGKKRSSPADNKDYSLKNKKPRTSPKKEKFIDLLPEEVFTTNTTAENTIIESNSNIENLSWVEKYRPKTIKQIIGQHGEASCAAKLSNWLSKWYQNRLLKIPAPSPWSKGDGGYYKAVLLSGSPGIGKTTTVTVVCKDLGFDMIEFNASDTRSKTLIKDKISGLTTTNTLSGYIHGKKKVTKKHVIIMDEVDGMAGNEDRGGMNELLSLIKNSEVPIICICNDKTSTKMRSLTNHCYELTFNKPKLEQIKAAMRSICFKEGIKISSDTLDELIKGTSQDIRQTLTMLSVWSVDNKNLTGDSDMSKKLKKDIKLGPWSVLRMVFSEEDHKKMNIHDKSSLFFHDYSLAPLFVQHNYLKVVPHCPKSEILDRFASAADSLSIGDLVESKIRKGMSWSLLPTQAMFSSVIPGTVLSGHSSDKIDFPAWLGQNSRTTKMNRLIQELHSHMRLSTSGSKQSIRLDYANHIRDAVLQPLIDDGTEGIQKSVDTLQAYHLLREDLDSLVDFTTWSGMKDKSALVNSKVKTAMTRKYNKEATPLPYSNVNIKKGNSDVGKYLESNEYMDSEEQEIIEEDSDVENDGMIKKLKKPSVLQPSKSRTASKSTKKGSKS